METWNTQVTLSDDIKSIFKDVENSDASISFAGSAGTGKTTIAHAVAELMPSKELITNITRKVKVEDRGTLEGQERILQNYIHELKLNEDAGFICDRTLFDVCAYSLSAKAWTKDKVDKILSAYTQCEFYPTYLFYVPIEFNVTASDIDRDPFLSTRLEVDKIIKELLVEYSLGFTVLTGTKEERLIQISKDLAV